MAKVNLKKLLQANPDAQKHEGVVRETLVALRQLRTDGFGGDGYSLSPAFGDKRILKASDKLILKDSRIVK